MEFYERLNDAVYTSYIDKMKESEDDLRAKLIYNDKSRSKTVEAELQRELKNCEEFWFSTAFITEDGLRRLFINVDEIRTGEIKGRLLTTDYNDFNSPDMFRKLLEYENIEVRVIEDFHIKGYMFKKTEMRKFIVGSANLTAKALRTNKEWSLSITSHENGEIIESIDEEFEKLWNIAEPLTRGWIDNYEVRYEKKKLYRAEIPKFEEEVKELRPNTMQSEALKSLENLRRRGKERALLISATGTGKTYLSAFDVKAFEPEKVLFLAHREKLLKQAEKSFKKVLGDDISSGILSGSNRDFKSNYLFSTVNMMSRNDIQENFSRDEFDYIIIDESHRAASESYRKIIEYFKPKFLLGMTATPERTDDGDIFEIFDYNIAYEIRLQQALEEDILCPFHYYGITDIDGYKDGKEFNEISIVRRAEFIIEKLKVYSFKDKRTRGLVFCSKIEEAHALSEEFSRRGYRSAALSGKDSERKREKMIERLEMDDCEEALDYIFSVDIMNEGVDIPSLNQVIMLRPTQSPIVFVQQLGRGLRKYDGKDSLLVLDFIANYETNYMIPIALSGDRSYNKDSLRRFVAEANKNIPGISTINFDKVAKQRIYRSLDKIKFDNVNFLKSEYMTLKGKIGRIPVISEFEKHGMVEIQRYFMKFGSYHNFLKKYDNDYSTEFDEAENQFIDYFSQKIANGKRIHEILMIKLIIENLNSNANLMTLKDVFIRELKLRYGIAMDEKEEQSVYTFLTNEFLEAVPRKKFEKAVYLSGELENYYPSRSFRDSLRDNESFKKHMEDLVSYAEARYEEMYSKRYKNTNLSLYKTYTYEDICRLLNWEKNLNGGTIGGYKYDEYTNTFPVLINYYKDEESISYHDRFIDSSRIIAISKSSRKTDSKDAKRIYGAKENGTSIYLFVRKNKDDESDKEFYFLGEVNPVGLPAPIKISGKPAFEIHYKLDKPVVDDVYDYITEESLDY